MPVRLDAKITIGITGLKDPIGDRTSSSLVVCFACPIIIY